MIGFLSKLTGIAGAVTLIGLLLFYLAILPHMPSKVPDRLVPDGLADFNKVILVDRDSQLLYTYEKGEQVHKFITVTGKTGKPTPLGTHKVAWKVADYKSREFDGAPMPYSMFIIPKRGIAIHGSTAIPLRWRYNEFMPGSPVGSAGCVSMTKANAKTLFEWTDVGTRVIVVGSPIASELEDAKS